MTNQPISDQWDFFSADVTLKIFTSVRDRLQILLLILNEFKRISEPKFSLESATRWFSGDIRGSRSWLICFISDAKFGIGP